MASALTLRLPAGLLRSSMPGLASSRCSSRSCWCLLLDNLLTCAISCLLANLKLLSNRDVDSLCFAVSWALPCSCAMDLSMCLFLLSGLRAEFLNFGVVVFLNFEVVVFLNFAFDVVLILLVDLEFVFRVR